MISNGPGLCTPNLSQCCAAPPSFLCCPKLPSDHLSNLTSVYPVLALHLSPCGSHQFSTSVQYSLIHSTRHLPYYSSSSTHFVISNTIHWRHLTQTFLTLHLKKIHVSHLSTSTLIPHASAPYNAVGTIAPSCRHFFAFIPNPLLLSTLFRALHSLFP